MQIVNGYICMNCCDVDKARLGRDPHQSADQLKKQIEQSLDKSSSGNFGPAVTFGGVLQADGANGASDANGSATNPTATAQPSGVNLLV